MCRKHAENIFGTRSWVTAAAAKSLSRFDPAHALAVLDTVNPIEQVKDVPTVLEHALTANDTDTAPTAILRSRPSSPIATQFVLVGSAAPLLERACGPGRATELLDRVLGATRL